MKTPVGAANRIIDRYLHPLAEKDPTWWVIDGLLHSTVEYVLRGQDTHRSVEKFIMYNLKPLLKGITNRYADHVDIFAISREISNAFDIDVESIITEMVKELWKRIRF